MTTDSATVGMAVGIPSGIIIIALLSVYFRSNRKINKNEEKIDPLSNVDLEADLTFNNYQELTGPQSPILEKSAQFNSENAENVTELPHPAVAALRSKSNKYRAYSYHPSMKAANNQTAVQNSALPNGSLQNGTRRPSHDNSDNSKEFPETTNDSSSTSTSLVGALPNAQPNNHSTINTSHIKRNSEHLLQNYFEGVIPVMPTKNTEIRSSQNSSTTNLAPPNPQQQDANSSHSGSSSNVNVAGPATSASKSPVASRTRSIFKRSKSLATNLTDSHNSATSDSLNPPNSHINNSGTTIAVSSSSDSLSQQHFIKSLNRNALESNDFTMPIPGSQRNSVIFEKRNLSSDLHNLNGRPNTGGSHSRLSHLASQQQQAPQPHLKSSTKLSKEVILDLSPPSKFSPPNSHSQLGNKRFYIESEANFDLDQASGSDIAHDADHIAQAKKNQGLKNPFENGSDVITDSATGSEI